MSLAHRNAAKEFSTRQLALLVTILCALIQACSKGTESDLRSPTSAPTPRSDSLGPSGDALGRQSRPKPSQIFMYNSDSVQQVGACGPLIVKLMDSYGTLRESTSKVTIDVSTESTTGTFYGDADCSSPSKSITINEGDLGSTIHFKDTTIGSAVITLSDSSNSGLAKTSGTLIIGEVAKLSFLGTVPIAVGECLFLVVQAQTSENKPIALASETTINLATTTATGGFYLDSECSNPISSVTIQGDHYERGSFYYKDTAAGSPTISASETPALGWTAASEVVQVFQN